MPVLVNVLIVCFKISSACSQQWSIMDAMHFWMSLGLLSRPSVSLIVENVLYIVKFFISPALYIKTTVYVTCKQWQGGLKSFYG